MKLDRRRFLQVTAGAVALSALPYASGEDHRPGLFV